MAFGSFNVLVRYALIDLGVRIDLPWQKITDRTKATGKAIDEKGDAPKCAGPHVAVGDICYPGGRRGILIYIGIPVLVLSLLALGFAMYRRKRRWISFFRKSNSRRIVR